MKLSREDIVGEAIALMRESGLAELSLRKLAARCDARAPSLARHVGDKANLLALMSHRLFCEALDDVPRGLEGAAWLEAFGWALWRKQQANRNIATLLAITPPHEALDADLLGRLQARMGEAKLSGLQASLVQSSVQALVTGWNIFAQSARGPDIGHRLPIDEAFARSLAALIQGFGLHET